MFKTLIAKFSFFFWLIFLLLNIFIYLFTTLSLQKMLLHSESEKMTLMLNTLKPTMAYYITFNQEEQFEQLLETILQTKGIEAIRVEFTDKKSILKQRKRHNTSEKLFSYKTELIDPFTHQKIANVKIEYSNIYATSLQKEILTFQVYLFLFALFLFSLFFLYVKLDLNALRQIAKTLHEYSKSKKIQTIERTDNRSQEIQTIANVANTMMYDIQQYVQELKKFNATLQDQIKIEVQKVQKHEKLMLHQSRQAAMGEILESIAHQWRQPLNIISVSIANLEVESMLGKIDQNSLQEKLALIVANTNYMSDTIDDFRNFLNPLSKTEVFDPKKSIEDVCMILQDELKAHNIHHTIIEEENLLIEGVENELKQLFFILINNAKDAIKNRINDTELLGGEITICITKDGDKGIISVEDNGGGIQEEIIDSVFEPYFSTKSASHGTGIGLYIGKNIVCKKFHGSLSVQNTDHGCCFSIKIPLQGKENEENNIIA